ncbi:MAG TPA: GNAT family N-acetyltransferase [Gaiellaceae bacterium]|nr:GNAT family N-acetyltransferase [Gaiellaceae bacterium]
MDNRDRIRAFGRALGDRLAERVVETPVGDALFVDELFDVYSLNYLRADRGKATEIAASADRAMEAFHHRTVSTYLDVDLGWPRATHLVMQHLREPDRRVDTTHVRRVPFAAIAESRMYDYEDRGLGERLNKAQLRVAAAVDTHWLAAYEGDAVAAWCHVRSRDGVAQIEDVNTLPEFRGRGHARAIVQYAFDEARATHDVVFLEALEDDWPRELYVKLGFTEIDRSYHHTRVPNPLTALRIITPRLELRLATVAELRALYRVAEAGVHDPDWMPFEIPWTDDLDEAGFLAYHLDTIAAWRPEEWRLNLITFLNGGPIGSQGLTADHFPQTRTLMTGSWLGLAHQSRGLGTEMRSAVLSFAFDALGAKRALSGALDRNEQSLGVSRKLGYREIGSHIVSPRGIPVEHTDLELTPGEFKPTVEARWEGFKPELFGL